MTVPGLDSLTYTFYRSVKSSTSCLIPRCGTTYMLEFHHVDPKSKINNVATIARTGTIEQLLTEMKKCVPICTAHHKRIHRGHIKGWLKGQFDNGKISDDREARRYMPFVPFCTGALTREAA